jgi:CheY-like chemotaxis protein
VGDFRDPSYAQHSPDVVLLDIMQPRLNGITVCRALLSRILRPRWC